MGQKLFEEQSLDKLIELQQKSYRLLQWVVDAIDRGFLVFNTVHTNLSLPRSAEAWLDEHYLNLPLDVRPEKDDVPALANLFAAFLENSFDIVANPKKQLYSPQAHCFCPCCSWLVAAPRLRAKKLHSRDKKRASLLMRDAVQNVALEEEVLLSNDKADEILEDRVFREAAAVCAYGLDLWRRKEGQTEGPATLALWRAFAWNDKGSPKKKFKLTSRLFIDAENLLRERLAGLQ